MQGFVERKMSGGGGTLVCEPAASGYDPTPLTGDPFRGPCRAHPWGGWLVDAVSFRLCVRWSWGVL